jgi:pimeloyl-ACP methyl ester carboxylesterase
MRAVMAVLGCIGLAAAAAAGGGAGEPTHEYFKTSDEVRIHFMRLGEAGSHVVLIHGYTGSAEGNWFRNGIAEALAANHRVVAIDCRNHGRSDKPQPRGPGKAEDVIEMMNHLGIEKAHIHGYSMGGVITGRLLASNPERFITAAFGGYGFHETDPKLAAAAAALDPEGRDPREDELSRSLRIGSAMNDGMSREQAERAADAARRPRPPTTISRRARPANPVDLTKVDIPVLAINGELDRPYSKTQRMWRELRNFSNVVLPGKSHLTAIVAGHMPAEYRDSLVAFIDGNDSP